MKNVSNILSLSTAITEFNPTSASQSSDPTLSLALLALVALASALPSHAQRIYSMPTYRAPVPQYHPAPQIPRPAPQYHLRRSLRLQTRTSRRNQTNLFSATGAGVQQKEQAHQQKEAQKQQQEQQKVQANQQKEQQKQQKKQQKDRPVNRRNRRKQQKQQKDEARQQKELQKKQTAKEDTSPASALSFKDTARSSSFKDAAGECGVREELIGSFCADGAPVAGYDSAAQLHTRQHERNQRQATAFR